MNFNTVVQFFREVRFELSKVEWPKFDEWVGSTLVVLVLVCFFSIYLGLVDFGFSAVDKYLFVHYGN